MTTITDNKKVSCTDEEAMANVRCLLEFIGEDPDREGLLKTPHRVINAMRDHFVGYSQDPRKFLEQTFSHVAYIPDGRVLGLSKIARVVDAYAKRLQIQEKLTAQIADAIQDTLQPQGVAVILKCRHFCMCYRGVKKTESWTTTSKLHGLFMNNPATRMELFTLLAMGSNSNG